MQLTVRPDSMAIVREIAALRELVRSWRRQDLTIGLVPTMGCLHRGHLSLVAASRKICARTIATIYVNPIQFGPTEDFAAYPRQEDTDLKLLAQEGCDAVFLPSDAEMFPAGFEVPTQFPSLVTVRGMTEVMCGAHREGHFDGMLTEVAKTFLIAQPDYAFFGEKDFQQLRVVEQMVSDLSFPLTVVGVPTVRESDGLALSSRNQYLSPRERQIAPLLHRTISAVAADLANARGSVEEALSTGIRKLEEGRFAKVDYLVAMDRTNLRPLTEPGRPGRVAAAAWLGRARLIDNIRIPL